MGECAMAGDGGEHGRVECVCVDCWEALCDSCSRVHRKTTLTRNHSVRLVADLTQMDIDRLALFLLAVVVLIVLAWHWAEP